MGFTKFQGVTGDRIGAVLREFSEADWQDAQTFLNLVMFEHDGDDVYAEFFVRSGADSAGVTDLHAAGYGLAQRIRERATND